MIYHSGTPVFTYRRFFVVVGGLFLVVVGGLSIAGRQCAIVAGVLASDSTSSDDKADASRICIQCSVLATAVPVMCT